MARGQHTAPLGRPIGLAGTCSEQNGVDPAELGSSQGGSGGFIAALAAGPSPGRVIVAASDYNIGLGGNRGVRIFSDDVLGPERNFWNQAFYHGSNVNNSSGAIPTIEQPSWLAPFHNMFRVQQYP
jgi:hypothetical protein